MHEKTFITFFEINHSLIVLNCQKCPWESFDFTSNPRPLLGNPKFCLVINYDGFPKVGIVNKWGKLWKSRIAIVSNDKDTFEIMFKDIIKIKTHSNTLFCDKFGQKE